MSNPVLSRPGVFAPERSASQPYAQPGYGQQPGSGQRSPGPQDYPPVQTGPQDRMTFDDVVTKSAMTIGLVIITAALSWVLLPDALSLPAALICGIVAFAVPFIAMMRRSVGAATALIYAGFEGVFIGGFSKIFEVYYPGIVMQAVLGTFVAAAVTLAAFKFGGFRLSSKMRKIVYLSMFGIVIVSLLSLVLSFFNINLGVYAGVTGPVGPLAWVFAGLGVVVAVFSLVDDFQYIEAGIAQGAPAKQSWTAAFGLTVTMVWLYTNILRILSYVRR